MGVMWTVWPLDRDMTAWLQEQGIARGSLASRWPTGSEIKQALIDLQLKIDVTDNGPMNFWGALVEAPGRQSDEWTHLIIREYPGDDKPQKLYFSKGHQPLICRILSRIAASSGPLVLLDDAGSPPEIVAAGG